MRLIPLLLIFVTSPAFSSDKVIEIMNAAPAECKSAFINYQKEIANGYLAHKKRIWLHDIEQLLKVRAVIISEGANNSQEYIDKILARKVIFLFSEDDLLTEQRSRVTDIKEVFMTYPLKVNNQLINNLNDKFVAFGI